MKFIIAFVIIAASAVPIAVAAHSGGLNAEGATTIASEAVTTAIVRAEALRRPLVHGA